MKLLNKLFLLFSIFVIASCNTNVIDETNGNKEEFKDKAHIEINLDPANSLVSKATDKDENVFYVYGSKDEDGNPVDLESISMENSNGDIIDFLFEGKDMPTLISSSNGVKFYLEWLSDTYATLTAIEPSTGFQVNTYIDLNETPEMTAAKSRSCVTDVQARTEAPRLEVTPIELPAETQSKSSRATGSTRAEISSGTIPVNLSLKNCEWPDDATCYVEVVGIDGKTLTKCKGNRVSQGKYVAHIPKSFYQETVDQRKIAEGCDKIADFMGKVCFLNNGVNLLTKLQICQTITLAIISSTGGSATLAAGIFDVTCSSASVMLEAYCNTLGAGPMDPAAPTVANGLCQLIKDYANKYASKVKLLPYVYAIPYNIYGQPQTVDLSNGYIPDMEISWGGEPNIASFKLTPSAPQQGQDYVGSAELRCMPKGTNIYMIIIGTDGYVGEQSYTISDSGRNFTANLYVPGAASGVRDQCKITVTLPDGKVLTKEASLVFH